MTGDSPSPTRPSEDRSETRNHEEAIAGDRGLALQLPDLAVQGAAEEGTGTTEAAQGSPKLTGK